MVVYGTATLAVAYSLGLEGAPMKMAVFIGFAAGGSATAIFPLARPGER